MTDQSPSTAPSLLVVDDNDEIRRLIRQALQRLEPRQVLEAADGVEAQALLQTHRVEVVITDVLMPRMDGRELMRWAQEHCPEPLWIVLSGLDTFDAAVEALQLGAFDFLAKPLRISRLRVAVRNALDQIALRREREGLYRRIERSNARLSKQVEQLSNLCRILEDQAQLIQEDLARAEVIQRALLPQTPPTLDGWRLESLYRPGRYVGGDFYDILELGDEHLGLVVADAAGHGVAAAMLSVLFKHRLTAWDDEAGEPLSPREVLRRANAALCADAATPGSFITAAYLLLNWRTGEALMAAAGHPPALWIHDGGGSLVDRTGPALGLDPGSDYTEQSFTMAHGDRMLCYTDGLLDGGPDAPSHDDLTSALVNADGNHRELLRSLYESATRNASHDPDDVTIILLARTEGRSRFDDSTSTAQPLPRPADQMELRQGADDGHAFISIRGTGTWMRSQAFFDAVTAAAEHHGSATIDFRDCEYLDSTFLGTLYELTVAHPASVHLQQVPPRLRSLFDELSMAAVIDCISTEPAPLPRGMEPLKPRSENAETQARRLLKAHELLATLSEENREQFQDVVDSLRQDLGS